MSIKQSIQLKNYRTYILVHANRLLGDIIYSRESSIPLIILALPSFSVFQFSSPPYIRKEEKSSRFIALEMLENK